MFEKIKQHKPTIIKVSVFVGATTVVSVATYFFAKKMHMEGFNHGALAFADYAAEAGVLDTILEHHQKSLTP